MQEKIRCNWCLSDPLYIKYHDEEWGIQVHDDRKLFEFLILEGAQAGLSWLTVLRKRENYSKAFDDFDFEILSKKISSEFLDKNSKILESNNESKLIEDLMNNPGIIRNRLKILSVFNNAHKFIEVRKEFGTFDNYLYSFLDNSRKQIINRPKNLSDLPTQTVLSTRISEDLRRRGFKFIGSTIIYAYMQAIGIVNDHLENCWRNIN